MCVCVCFHTLFTGEMHVLLFSLSVPSCNLLLFVSSPTLLLAPLFRFGVVSSVLAPEPPVVMVTMEVNWCTKECPSVGVRGEAAWTSGSAQSGCLGAAAMTSLTFTQHGLEGVAAEGVVKKLWRVVDWRSCGNLFCTCCCCMHLR